MLETKFPSPTGKYHFQISPWEARMSLWIESPTLVETEGSQTILTFKDSNWSLDSAQWLDEERVKMHLRRYPGDHSPSAFEVEVDCLTKQATVGSETYTLEFIEPHLEALCHPNQTDSPHARSGRASRLFSALSRLLKQ